MTGVRTEQTLPIFLMPPMMTRADRAQKMMPQTQFGIPGMVVPRTPTMVLDWTASQEM